MIITREVSGTKEVLVQSIVTYQMYGDADPRKFLKENFDRSKQAGYIQGYDIIATQPGVWGIVMCVVLVQWWTDVLNSHEQADESATLMMNEVVGDSDVEVLWTGAIEENA